MASLNKVILIGNVTRDVELKYIPSGSAVADIGLAINEKYKDKSGEAQESTVFVDVVAWGNQAEICSSYLQKGSLVMVEGSLQLDQWQTKEGEKRSKIRVKAMRVQFMDSKPKGARAEPQQDQEPVHTPAADELLDDDNLPF